MANTFRGHIPALDGVRGLAILLVIAFHARVVFGSTAEIPYLGFRLLGLGWSGVDLFFVLSGFLITGILLDSCESPTYFRTFYLRRVLRIFPLYFAYLFLILVVARFTWLAISGTDLWQSTNPWWYFTYLLNWKADHGYNDHVLGHLWSLAIEEQFYMVWPAVVWLAPRRHLQWLCLAVAAGALGARFWMGSHGFDSEAVYRMTPGRMDTLALGAFVAVGVRDFRAALERHVNEVLLVSAAAFMAVWTVNPSPVWSDLTMRTVGASLIAVVYACIVFHAAPYHLTADAMHNLSQHGYPALLVTAAKYLYFPALVGVAYGAARISWRFLEYPFIRLKEKVGDPARSAASTRPQGNTRLAAATSIE